MFALRSVSDFWCIPLVLCSLMCLCMASPINSAPTKTRQPTTKTKNSLAQEDCETSRPLLPPSVIYKPRLLYTRSTYFLQITSDGHVNGERSRNNFTELALEMVGTCLFRIKGIATGRYLAMRNVSSELYTQVQPNTDAVFRYSNPHDKAYYVLQSYPYSSWYVGLRKGGKPKKGKKVKINSDRTGGKFFILSPGTKTHSLQRSSF